MQNHSAISFMVGAAWVGFHCGQKWVSTASREDARRTRVSPTESLSYDFVLCTRRACVVGSCTKPSADKMTRWAIMCRRSPG